MQILLLFCHLHIIYLFPSFNSFFCKDTCDVLILFMAVNTILHRRTVLRHCTVIYHVNGKLTLCKRLVVNTASFVHDSLITTCTQHFFEIPEMNIFQGYVLAVLHAQYHQQIIWLHYIVFLIARGFRRLLNNACFKEKACKYDHTEAL